MVRSSVVILFNPSKTEFLVGKESYWITNIKSLDQKDKGTIDTLFSRPVKGHLSHDDVDEVAYYKGQVAAFKHHPLMDKMRPLSKSQPPRITFGDIKYKKKGGQWYSFTIPQYLPIDSLPNFPAGGIKANANSELATSAIREFYEEAGIDLLKEPFSVSRLIDSGIDESGYRIFYYITNEAEYLEAQANITTKNLNSFAEIHELEFVNVNKKIINFSRRQYSRISKTLRRPRPVKKTRSSKQRWTRSSG